MKPRYAHSYAEVEHFLGHLGEWDVWEVQYTPDGNLFVMFIKSDTQETTVAKGPNAGYASYLPVEIAAYLQLKYGTKSYAA